MAVFQQIEAAVMSGSYWRGVAGGPGACSTRGAIYLSQKPGRDSTILLSNFTRLEGARWTTLGNKSEHVVVRGKFQNSPLLRMDAENKVFSG